MMNMDAFDAYKVYIALKSHFNSDYDFNKYHGKTRVNLDSFLKRSDRLEKEQFTYETIYFYIYYRIIFYIGY